MSGVTENLSELAKQIAAQEAAITRVAQAIEDTREGFDLASHELTATVKALEGYKRLSSDSETKATDLRKSLENAAEQGKVANGALETLVGVASGFEQRSQRTVKEIEELRTGFSGLLEHLEAISKDTATDARLEAVNRVAHDLNGHLGRLNEQINFQGQKLEERSQLEEANAKAIAGLERRLDELNDTVSASVNRVGALLDAHTLKTSELVGSLDKLFEARKKGLDDAAALMETRITTVGETIDAALAKRETFLRKVMDAIERLIAHLTRKSQETDAR